MTTKLLLVFIIATNITTAQWKTEGIAVADSNAKVNGNYYPKVVTDGRGGCYISWMDFRNGTDINIYVQRLDSTGREVFQHNGIPVVTAPNFQIINLCMTDGKGGIFFTWTDEREPQYDYIYAQHMDSSGNMLWQTNGIKVSKIYGVAAQVIADSTGGIIINYSSSTSVGVQRIDSAGNRMWGDSGISQSTNNGYVDYMHSASDGKGGIIVSWIILDDSGIYAQRIRHNGSVAWGQNGIRLSIVDTVRYTTHVISDGNYGAIIDWVNGSNVEVRAQRVDSNGTLLWGNNGIHIGYGGIGITILLSDQKGGAIIPVYPRLYRIRNDGLHVWSGGINFTNSMDQMWLVSDSASGVVIAYSRRYDASPLDDMYAQRIDSSGVVRWKSNGVAIANYNYSDKFHPDAVSDGKGGVIAAWNDDRPNYGVYAGKVNSEGKVLTGVFKQDNFSIPNNLNLYQNYPNPFNPSTIINYQLPINGFVTLKVYDLLGREIETLVDGTQNSGKHSIRFDGQRIPSGIYFYRLNTGLQTITKKMVIIH
ncbi:MAG: T9SS type A sorting domain-containing protein [Bacteroidota bacterium]|nr:T9SS type A sorting domain-containing protein [Bacteroidota bacterium]